MKIDKYNQLLQDIESKTKQFTYQGYLFERGSITFIGASIVGANGIHNCFIGEVVQIGEESQGYIFGFRGEEVQIILLDTSSKVKVGDPVFRTGQALSIPAGRGLIGRIVDPTGRPIDGRGPLVTSETRLIEKIAPSVIERKPVSKPIQTGIKVVDSMIPIGKGQRELIIGDRQTGKSSILIDTIINQKDANVICIYVAIAQRASTVSSIVETLSQFGALDYTSFIVSLAEDPPSLRYLAPFSGSALAEYFAQQGKDVLIVYDDLSKHADSYRELSLLLQRPPAREAYPSDIFYLHSRLLERAGNFADSIGGGSITALPVVETYGGDISQYIPTNLISITDGQIYLEKELFNTGVRPAINVGLSVSRVGSSAQTGLMKQVSKGLRLDLSQYHDLKTFTEFGAELDKDTLYRLKRGELLVELMKQPNNQPVPLILQVFMLYAYHHHLLDEIDLTRLQEFADQMYAQLKENAPQLIEMILRADKFTEELEATGKKHMIEFIQNFKKSCIEETE
ncbi:F0F1 ATP synthase subunit alpha [bacterium]|nr:F0F1 ATP synthase subunit alpha [bacterium]